MTIERAHELKDEASLITKKYSVPLVKLTGFKDIEAGSGTLIIINGRKGILTNEHVSRMFEEKKACLTAPGTETDVITRNLEFINIISLPAKQMDKHDDADMAFMELNSLSIAALQQMGKDFWDLDNATLEYNKHPYVSYGASLWLIHGNVTQGLKHRYFPEKAFHLFTAKNAAPYVVVPNVNVEYSTCYYEQYNLTIIVDNINCPINTKDATPTEFDGMSGAALWQVHCELQGIRKIELLGIATQPQEDEKTGEVNALICRGPMTLYKGFYPFVFLVF